MFPSGEAVGLACLDHDRFIPLADGEAIHEGEIPAEAWQRGLNFLGGHTGCRIAGGSMTVEQLAVRAVETLESGRGAS